MEANTSEYTSSKSTVPAEYDQLGLPELLKLVADLKVRAAKLQEADKRFDVTSVEKKVKPFSGEKEIGIRKWFVNLEKAFAELKLTEDEKLIAVRRLLDGTAAQFLRTIRTVDYADMKRQLVAEFEPDADAAYVRNFQKEAIKIINLAFEIKCPDEELEDYFIASLDMPPDEQGNGGRGTMSGGVNHNHKNRKENRKISRFASLVDNSVVRSVSVLRSGDPSEDVLPALPESARRNRQVMIAVITIGLDVHLLVREKEDGPDHRRTARPSATTERVTNKLGQ
uniref:Uncharacterized protein n=1 Tax=Anopheles atroparvus TaxID=41427 RepID=A0A182IXS0_ANOAO